MDTEIESTAPIVQRPLLYMFNIKIHNFQRYIVDCEMYILKSK